MLFLYNILWFLFLPVLFAVLGCRSKYRRRLPSRLGIGLRPNDALKKAGRPTIWIHALSVGEVTSAIPLARALRADYPQAYLLFSVTTATGKEVAKHHLRDIADKIIDGPVDFLPVVRHFLKNIAPDLYILVETDYWPNLLHSLKRRNIPALLVNGRISAASMRRYQRGRFFFLPMFGCFSALAMQTASDRDKMCQLGLAAEHLPILGNLKFATLLQQQDSGMAVCSTVPKGKRLFIAGSTHPGEESVLFEAYRQLRRTAPDLFMVLVPRNPQRGTELTELARQFDLQPRLRSAPGDSVADLLIVDTIGELLAFYSLAAIAFVGGSLVAKGGHNPLEPASLGVPVLFGPHMEDFSEIADLLLEAGGAKQVGDGKSLVTIATTLLVENKLRATMGETARQVVMSRGAGVIDTHLQLIRTLL